MDLAVPPLPSGCSDRHALGVQLPGDGGRALSLLDVHLVDAPHDLGSELIDLGPAVLCDAVAVGDVADGDPALLGRAALAHRGSFTEVVQLDLADGGHETEGLHVDGVHDGLDVDAVGL